MEEKEVTSCNRMERYWSDILQPHVRASKVRLSYVEEIFPSLKNKPYIILHKNVPGMHVQHLSDHKENEGSFDEYSSRHDVSGSPLKYSFGTVNLEDTVLITRQNWRKEEELYLPLSKMDAINNVNVCMEHLNTITFPILALCDGKDHKQTRLIGFDIFQDGVIVMNAFSTGLTSLATVRNECHKVVQEHLKPFAQEQHCLNNTKVSMFNAVDLFGVKQETIDWDKTAKSDFEGCINVEMHSDSLDSRMSKNTLLAQINAGWKDSLLKELRSQLFLLIQYLSAIDECKKNIGLQNPIIFTTPHSKEKDIIDEKLNLLLNGDFSLQKSESYVKKNNHISKENAEFDAKLQERVQDVSLRHDIDFTDLLWEIISKASTYPQMVNCLETVLKEILEHKFTPQINDTNSTKFAKCISNLHHQETTSHLLVGSVPLELVVDMGFEKLTRDYLYILRGARLIDLHDFRQKLIMSSRIFDAENYRNKLITLAQIHISLECMLLVEAHLECPIESLHSLFAYAYKEFVSTQSPLQHHNELCNRIFTLTAPLPHTLANELNKMNPSVLKASVLSHSAASELTTTTYYYSKIPIFPTNIYSTSDNENVQEEMVYSINAISRMVKFRKL
ncbi:protein zwilch homolog isoform X2 [Solenopsis invicta]|uniref:protein zwilch homolog isoform X2 n=1 Tax=Solenopsis invicta TaxID=13686 RepID=UPI00193CC67D|nr:protein zwilch homolog isoform X2 [Solenopsis invicta]